jgi:prolyl-tRNA editing enzyme YbaK/EbsC (Cys-tRNA(Pro) deacylase)
VATGYERGTIVPVGSSTDWPVFADERIVGERIAMGAGAHGYSMFVEADDLIAAYAATVADISQAID